MSEPAVAVAPSTTQRQSVRIGSFVVGPRVLDAGQRLGSVVLVAVSGESDSPRAGVDGFGYCSFLGEPRPDQLELAKAVLDRIAALSGPAIVPVLEAGVAGRIAYVVEAPGPGERLSDRLARDGAVPPHAMVSIATALASALDTAHQRRISHGMIVPATVWLGERGIAQLGGFGLLGRGPGRDQSMLAALCLEMLSGSPWAYEPSLPLDQQRVVERIRSVVHGLTEPLAAVFARALASDPETQFPSVLAFGESLSRVVQASAVEMAAGAWEAISRRDMAMAELLTDMTAGYDPASPEVRLLRVRLKDGSGATSIVPPDDPLQSMEGLFAIEPATLAGAAEVGNGSEWPEISSTAQRTEPAEPSELLSSPQGPADPAAIRVTQGETEGGPRLYDEAELRRLFMPAPVHIEPSRGNPWVIFLTIVFAMVALLALLAAIVFARS